MGRISFQGTRVRLQLVFHPVRRSLGQLRMTGIMIVIISAVMLSTLVVFKEVLQVLQDRIQSNECKQEALKNVPEHELGEEEIPENAIFFLGTANVAYATPKQLCVFESAALHNPEKTVFISWNSPRLKLSTGVTLLLQTYTNIKYSLFKLKNLLKGTTLEPWLDLRLLDTESKFPVAHMADIARCAFLFKHGGIYLDHDMMVLKNLGNLHNTMGFERIDWLLGTNMLAFEKEHPILDECLKRIWAVYKPSEYISIGPEMMNDIMRDWCDVPKERQHEFLVPGVCRNVTMLPSYLTHYPYKELNLEQLYGDDIEFAKQFLQDMKDSFTVHMWNVGSSVWPIRVQSNQPFALLAQKNCPIISSLYDVFWGCDAHDMFVSWIEQYFPSLH